MLSMFEVACWADIGDREEQQDRVAVLTREDTYLLVVAVGLGGHENGALAAQCVVDEARERFRSAPNVEPLDLLTGITRRAHARINQLGAETNTEPRSTCVLLHIGASEAVWGHTGDSRLYRFENARLVERTLDHSPVEMLRLEGRIDEEQMKRHPDRNRLFEALGGQGTLAFEIARAPLSTQSGFVLASDGLWENISDAELETVFEAERIENAVRDLVARAKIRGGPLCDNIAVAAIRRGRAPAESMQRSDGSEGRRSGAIR